MHYDVRSRPAVLRHDPFKALAAPRPIGWLATLDAQGRPNLAPYRFYNAGLVDTAAIRPIARMGYMDDAVVTPETTFTLQRPLASPDGLSAVPQEGAWDGVHR